MKFNVDSISEEYANYLLNYFDRAKKLRVLSLEETDLIQQLKHTFMKQTPEQRIAELEKELADLKIELKTKERTLFEIRHDWQKTSSNIICKRDRELKVQAICDMIAVADELNGDWEPDWKNGDQRKYYIYIYESKINTDYSLDLRSSFCYFKTKEHAQQAISILGEEKIKLALS